MKKTIYILFLPLLIITISSCDKFRDGGSRKKAEANLTNIWILDGYSLNDEDKTGDLVISGFEETFADNGVYTRIYIDGTGAEVNQIGSWTLDEENEQVMISGGGAMDLTSSITGVSTSRYKIIKLKKKSFWYQFESGADTHEFRMIPKD